MEKKGKENASRFRSLSDLESLLVGFNSKNVAAGSVQVNKKRYFQKYLKDM